MNRLTNLTWKLTTTLGTFYYQLGTVGNRTNLTETVNGSSRGFAWIYDKLYRLTNETISVSAPMGTIGYQFDAVGNRTNRTSTVSGIGAQTPTYGTNDWLTSDVYDNDGNTKTNGSNVYLYDYANRLTNANSGAVVLVYDADGNRIKRITSTATNLYLVSTVNPSGYAQVVEEFQSSSAVTNLSRVYTYGLGLISQRQGTTNYFFGSDGHGSTRFLTDGSGTVANAFTYDAYGNLIASNTTAQTVFLYCGEQFDSGLGSYYLRARLMNPNTGRFWTMDTDEGDNEDPLSLHKYLYGEDNPVDNVDPSGHDIGDVLDVLDMMTVGFSFSPKLAVSALVNKSRPLTQGEIRMSKTIFGSAIDYTKPMVYNRPWIAQSRWTAVTPNGNIYMRGDGTSVGDAGGLYRPDFSLEPNVYLRAVFIHEMTHVWQYQHGVWVKTRAAFNRRYSFDFSKLGTKDFKKYGLEQQAMIVEDSYILESGYPVTDDNGDPIPNVPPLQTFLKVTSPYFP
jgi:RHS repeat-associated protein